MRPSRAPKSSSHAAGFTLLEVMVVILIIGVMVTFASLSIGSRVNEDKLENEARRAEAVIKLASEEAEAKGLEIGLRFTNGGYRLLRYDATQRWLDYEESGPLRRRIFAAPFALDLRVEGRPVKLPADLTPEQELELRESTELKGDRENEALQLTPQVLLLSSGEITAFSLQMTAPGVAASYRVEGDALGRVQLVRGSTANTTRRL